MRLLVVCSANRCRSPMAEALLRHLIAADGRRRFDMLGGSAEDDIADPMGGSRADFQRTADQLRSLCRRAVDLLGVCPSPSCV